MRSVAINNFHFQHQLENNKKQVNFKFIQQQRADGGDRQTEGGGFIQQTATALARENYSSDTKKGNKISRLLRRRRHRHRRQQQQKHKKPSIFIILRHILLLHSPTAAAPHSFPLSDRIGSDRIAIAIRFYESSHLGVNLVIGSGSGTKCAFKIDIIRS